MSGSYSFNATSNTTASSIVFNRNRSNDSNRQNNFDSSSQIIFYLLTTMALPSIVCFIFLFYHLIHQPHLRNKGISLLIILLLFNNFVHMLLDLPFRLYYLSKSQVPIQHPAFCFIWLLLDNILTTADLLLIALISIERYLFVFHYMFHRTFKRCLYRISIGACFSLPTVWYIVLAFAYPCRNSFRYNAFQCGSLCYFTAAKILVDLENIILFICPIILILVGNIILITRVLIQKRLMKREHRMGLWRNNFRMISQLLFITTLYMSVYVPSCALLIMGNYVRNNRYQSLASSIRTRYFIHLKYLVILGCPFMILVGQKELHQIIAKKLFRHSRDIWRGRFGTQIFPMATIQTRFPDVTRL